MRARTGRPDTHWLKSNIFTHSIRSDKCKSSRKYRSTYPVALLAVSLNGTDKHTQTHITTMHRPVNLRWMDETLFFSWLCGQAKSRESGRESGRKKEMQKSANVNFSWLYLPINEMPQDRNVTETSDNACCLFFAECRSSPVLYAAHMKAVRHTANNTPIDLDSVGVECMLIDGSKASGTTFTK